MPPYFPSSCIPLVFTVVIVQKSVKFEIALYCTMAFPLHKLLHYCCLRAQRASDTALHSSKYIILLPRSPCLFSISNPTPRIQQKKSSDKRPKTTPTTSTNNNKNDKNASLPRHEEEDPWTTRKLPSWSRFSHRILRHTPNSLQEHR